MFSDRDIEIIKQSPYTIITANHHDVTIHSPTTGHDWIIVSNYETAGCYLMHRHSGRDPYHRQQGQYKDLREALDYVTSHDKWFAGSK